MIVLLERHRWHLPQKKWPPSPKKCHTRRFGDPIELHPIEAQLLLLLQKDHYTEGSLHIQFVVLYSHLFLILKLPNWYFRLVSGGQDHGKNKYLITTNQQPIAIIMWEFSVLQSIPSFFILSSSTAKQAVDYRGLCKARLRDRCPACSTKYGFET